MAHSGRFATALLCACAALALSRTAHALDKQASAHGGTVAGPDSGFGISGSVLLGIAVYNPTYAARPDNTGRALLRFAPHLDIDLIGRRLSIPIDLNFFSDRERRGLGKLAPSEFDFIAGLTSTWPVSPLAAVEFGVRGETDRPVDRTGYTQTYGDARVRLLYQLTPALPRLDALLGGGGPSGVLTLGWFFWNPSYAARPDNTGIALLRYGVNLGCDAWKHRVSLSVDATFFTDRHRNAVTPTELDLTLALGVKVLPPATLQLAFERDMPLDRGGRVQQFLIAAAVIDLGSYPTHDDAD